MKYILLCAFSALLFTHTAQADHHGSAGLKHVESPYSVSETADKLVKVLTSKGITMFARVNHAKGAANIGQSLPPTVLLIFGNPKLGTPLMNSNREIGLDLPLKALIWETAEGKTKITYNDPAYLKMRHKIMDQDGVFQKMTGALQKLIGKAVE